LNQSAGLPVVVRFDAAPTIQSPTDIYAQAGNRPGMC